MKTLGQIAYEEFEERDLKNAGIPFMPWHNINSELQQQWEDAANVVAFNIQSGQTTNQTLAEAYMPPADEVGFIDLCHWIPEGWSRHHVRDTIKRAQYICRKNANVRHNVHGESSYWLGFARAFDWLDSWHAYRGD